MSHDDLRRLADEGVSEFPPANLDSLATWCDEYCFSANVASYCLLARTFRSIAIRWENAVPASLARDLDATIQRGICSFLDAQIQHESMAAATLVHQDVSTVLRTEGLV